MTGKRRRVPPPPFPKNSPILVPVDKQNHFSDDFETPNTRAPLFIFLEFNETEQRNAQWERVVKLTKNGYLFRVFRLDFSTFLMIAPVLRIFIQMQLSDTLLAFGLTCLDKIYFCQATYTMTV